jgi:hypothetical protein
VLEVGGYVIIWTFLNHVWTWFRNYSVILNCIFYHELFLRVLNTNWYYKLTLSHWISLPIKWVKIRFCKIHGLNNNIQKKIQKICNLWFRSVKKVKWNLSWHNCLFVSIVSQMLRSPKPQCLLLCSWYHWKSFNG